MKSCFFYDHHTVAECGPWSQYMGEMSMKSILSLNISKKSRPHLDVERGWSLYYGGLPVFWRCHKIAFDDPTYKETVAQLFYLNCGTAAEVKSWLR
jgi:hypothetical protein